MISLVQGTVIAQHLDRIVVLVGGIGLTVYTTPTSLAQSTVGASTTLHTTLVVREDSLTIFGFSRDTERDMFESLQSISGVGPKVALAALSVLDPVDIATAVASADVTTLMKIPGVGKKGAQRWVLELGDRLAPHSAPAPAGRSGLPAPRTSESDQVVQALVGLGWAIRSADDAVMSVRAEHTDATEPQILKLALQKLGGERR